eukprot:RCo050598
MSKEISSVLWDDGPPLSPDRRDVPFYTSQYSQQQIYPESGREFRSSSSPFAGELEKPLLEGIYGSSVSELGIDFALISRKTKIVCNPFRAALDGTVLHDSDLAGPLLIAVFLGLLLLTTGRVHFGYIFGMGMGGCVLLYALLNVMTERAVDLQYTVSTMGYCLFPTSVLAFFHVLGAVPSLGLYAMPRFLSYPLALLPIFWSSWCATRMFVDALGMSEQRWLILYPITLVYSAFALISVF